MNPSYTISPLGDSALLIHFDNLIDEALNEKVLSIYKTLKTSSLPFVDVVPAYGSIAVYYDPLKFHAKEQTAFNTIKELVEPLITTEDSPDNASPRQIKIPVCYAKKFALDSEELARQRNISTEDIIHLHTATTYRVYMIGFLPGFAYMGRVDMRLATPRMSQPRTFVPAGSVGIAGEQTGIYPLTSPGGWNIIGRTPLKIFDTAKDDAVFFQPGDAVTFYSITEDEFENYQGRNS